MTIPTDESPKLKSLMITEEQGKLLRSAMRIRILRALNDHPMTAKQVADAIGGTKGNVHYHMTQLYEAGLIELVETRELNSIEEKYYQAKASVYKTGHSISVDEAADGRKRITLMGTRLTLTPDQLALLNHELLQVLLKWEEKTVRAASKNVADYLVEITLSGAENVQR